VYNTISIPKHTDSEEEEISDLIENLDIRNHHPQIAEHIPVKLPVWEPFKAKKLQLLEQTQSNCWIPFIPRHCSLSIHKVRHISLI
jgi:hypothetical protein